MSYLYLSRLGGRDGARFKGVMKRAADKHLGGQTAYIRAKALGIAGRKQNFLDDYRRFQAVENTKTPESRARASLWYDEVFEPFRKDRKMNSRQASDLLSRIRKGSVETVEDAENMGAYYEQYDKVF